MLRIAEHGRPSLSRGGEERGAADAALRFGCGVVRRGRRHRAFSLSSSSGSTFLPSPGGGGSPAERAGWGGGLSPAVVFQRFNLSFKRTMQLDVDPLNHGSQITRD